MTTSKWFVILRDFVLLAVGVFGILHQEITGQANPLLLATYTTLLGIPGAANALSILLRNNGNGGSGQSGSQQREHSVGSEPSSRRRPDDE